jgi:hypothetical protein
MTNVLCVNRVALLSIIIAGCVVGDSGPEGNGPKVKPDDTGPGACYKVSNTGNCGGDLPAGVT